MINKILPLLKQAIPTAAAMKGIAAADPKLKSFIFAASAAGYGADMVMDFLRSVGGQTGEKEFDERTKKRKDQGKARPDELADLADTERAETAQSVLKTGIGLAAGLGAAGAAGKAAGMASGAVIPEVLAAEEAAAAAPAQMGFRQKAIAGGADLRQLAAPAAQKQLGQIAPKQKPPVAPQPQPQPQAAAAPVVPRKPRTHFEKAMQGVDYFDLSDDIKPNVGKLAKRLDQLEHDGVPFKDKSVQKIVRGLRKMVKREGILYDPKYQPKPRAPGAVASTPGAAGVSPAEGAPAGPSSDDQLMDLLDQFSQRFLP